jgi:hypothetical protein
MKSSVVGRSRVSVEDAFWKGLQEIIVKRRDEPLSDRQFANRNISALPPRADVGADIVEPPVCGNPKVNIVSRRQSRRSTCAPDPTETSARVSQLLWSLPRRKLEPIRSPV